jgi:hypothetical protein
VAYALSSGSTAGLHLDARQFEELFLTAAQSAFAVVLIARLNSPGGRRDRSGFARVATASAITVALRA